MNTVAASRVKQNFGEILALAAFAPQGIERHGKLVAADAVERLVPDADIAAAVTEPPSDTRAYFRGSVVRLFPGQVRAASWDSVVLDVPRLASLRRIPLTDPWRGTEAHVRALLESCTDAGDLVDRLAHP